MSWGSGSWGSGILSSAVSATSQGASYLQSLYSSSPPSGVAGLDLSQFEHVPIDFNKKGLGTSNSTEGFELKTSKETPGKMEVVAQKILVNQTTAGMQWKSQKLFTDPKFYNRNEFSFLVCNFLPAHHFSKPLGTMNSTELYALKNRALITNPKSIKSLPTIPCHLITQEKTNTVSLCGLILSMDQSSIPTTNPEFSQQAFFSSKPENPIYYQHTVKGLLNNTKDNLPNIVRVLPQNVKIVGIWVKTTMNGKPLISQRSYDHLKYLAKFLSPKDSAPHTGYLRSCACKCHEQFAAKIDKINKRYQDEERRIRHERVMEKMRNCRDCQGSPAHHEQEVGYHIPSDEDPLPIIPIPVPENRIKPIAIPEKITSHFERFFAPYDGYRLTIGDLTYELMGINSRILKDGTFLKKMDSEIIQIQRMIHAYLPEKDRVREEDYPDFFTAYNPSTETIIDLFEIT